MQPNLSASLTSAVSRFRTREADAKIMSILMATFRRGLTLGYTCYQKASSAFSNAPPIHVLPVGFARTTPPAKNKSLEASCMLVACCECMNKKVGVSQLRHVCICKGFQDRNHFAIVQKEYEQAKLIVGGQICIKILPLSRLTVSLFPETTLLSLALPRVPTGACFSKPAPDEKHLDC